jgi:hypothetical protein
MLTIERWIVRTKGLPNPSADFSSMHSGGVGNVSTDAPTHAAMPHFLVHFIKFPFPVYCFFNCLFHHANSYLLQGPEQRTGHYADRSTEHEGNFQNCEAYSDANTNYEVSNDV